MAAKRILKMILIAIASIVAVILAAIGGLFAYAAIDKDDMFYVANAEPVDPGFLLSLDSDPERNSFDRKRFGFAAHRLKPGRGAVFGYRFYSNGNVVTVDDELYRKVTVWIPAGLPQSTVDFDLSNRASAVVISSDGGSAWPRADCSGYISSGSLRVEHRGARYVVRVHGQLEPRGNSNILKQCIAQRVDLEFEAKPLPFDQLTPWLGIAGAHPYDETYR